MAQRNVLQYVILGLLSQHERTGYELSAAFTNEIGEFWQAQHSQIYPQLGKLEDQGFIQHEKALAGKKLEKKVYRLTDSGRTYLNDWVGDATTALPVTKDEFALKLFFIKDASDARLPGMLQEQIDLHQEWLAHLTVRMGDLFTNATQRAANFGHYLVLSRAVERETDYLRWLQETAAGLSRKDHQR